MPDEPKGGEKKPQCSGFLCDCAECGGRKRKEDEAKKEAKKWGKDG